MATYNQVMVRVYVDICAVPAGVGPANLTQEQSNEPGFGQAPLAGVGPIAQTMRVQAAEMVPGGSTPTLANLLTALQSIATDLAGATGTPKITPAMVTQIGNWASGNP